MLRVNEKSSVFGFANASETKIVLEDVKSFSEENCFFFNNQYNFCLYIYTNPSARAGYDTR